MKIIAVNKKIPFTLQRKNNTNLISLNKLEKLLKTPQSNKASSIKPVLDRITPVNSIKDVEVKHNSISSVLLRDVKDVIYIGMLDGLEILEDKMKDKILKILQKDYKTNSFYPIALKECMFGKMIEDLCYNKNWDYVLFKEDIGNLFNQCLEYNKILAEEILNIYKFGDIVWITDPLHFILPKLLREKIADIKISVSFLQPFPSFDKFACFSHPVEILESLLQASCIDFQCKNDLNNFVNFAKINTKCTYKNKVIKHKREVNLSVNQIVIKEDLPNKVLSNDLTQKYISQLKNMHKGKKLVVSVSKLDSNYLLNIYKAIDYFLKNFNSDVIFVNLELPIGEYNTDEKAEISRIEDYLRLNGYEDNFKRLCVPDYKYYAYISMADTCIILDDLFTAMKDFTFINKNKPLIVHKMLRLEKTGFIGVNPKDEIKLANKIKEALKTGKTKLKYNDEVFNSSFTKFISKIKKGVKKRLTLEKTLPENNLDLIKEKFISANKRAFIFDYDGTLTRIVDKPDNAFPSDVVKDFLKKLSENNKVILSTGRDKATVDKWFPKELEVYAEHGSLRRLKGDWSHLSEVHGWKEYAREIMNYYVERSPGSLLEEKETSLVFHYRNCDPIIQEKQAQACVSSLLTTFKDFPQLEVHEGKCVVEIKPSGKNKGDLIKMILEKDYDFIFCAGDDVTDEDMFIEGRLKDVFHSVLVGNRESYAKYRVNTPEDLISFVNGLNK